MQPKRPRINPLIFALALAAVLMIWSVFTSGTGMSGGSTMSYSTVVHYFEHNQVTKFTLDRNTSVITLTLKEGDLDLPQATAASTADSTGGLLSGMLSSSSADSTAAEKNSDGTVTVRYKLPYAYVFIENVQSYIDSYDAANPTAPMEYDYTSLKETIPWMEILFYLGMLGCTGFLLFSMMRGGGAGGGIAHTHEELVSIVSQGLELSPAHEVLVEESIEGWKEYEMEVMRDHAGNGIIVCSIENLDPMGVHTGDSITVAPAQTLSDLEYQRMRVASLAILEKIGVETGGSNVQFAVNPNTGRLIVIEMNPRVSRSSALASKATGFPIAKAAARLAVGYTLDEIVNDITKATPACFEPTIDYCVVKVPRFAFEKFKGTDPTLTTRMKAVGEIMAIGRTFEEAFGKAMRSLEDGHQGICAGGKEGADKLSDDELAQAVATPTEHRIFFVVEALRRGWDIARIHAICGIDPWYLNRINDMVQVQESIRGLRVEDIDADAMRLLKQYGTSDAEIAALTGSDERFVRAYRKGLGVVPSMKTVDTCAAEFSSATEYHYKTYENIYRTSPDAKKCVAPDETTPADKPKAMILGAGPNRIGQGIEFDYCCVHASYALAARGFETIMVNCNPETVSTDYDTSDRLYFEPLTYEDVMDVIDVERPDGVVVTLGGQTPLKLARMLEESGVNIMGTKPDAIDFAEDRERFDELLERCNIPRAPGRTVFNLEEALAAADEIGLPVLMRPSYVLGGQNMIVAYTKADVIEYMGVITEHVDMDHPVLLDKYIMGTECEVDAICDGENFLIPGVMEQIERTGVHSGDSICVYPAQHLTQAEIDTMVDYTGRFARELHVTGLVNVQYAVSNGKVYVIEVNPRSSRTVPYISKVTGVPMVDLAVRCCLGEKLTDMGYGTGLHPNAPYVAVKVPVFSFEKLHGVDTQFGPEMKSTGEVLGIAPNFHDALLKGLIGAGYTFKTPGPASCCIFTVKDGDKPEFVDIAWKLKSMGYKLYGTSGTCAWLNKHMVPCNEVRNMSGESPNIVDLLQSGLVDYVFSTSAKGRDPKRDSVRLRRKAVELSIPCITAVDTANALVECLRSEHELKNIPLVDIATLYHKN